MRIGVIGGGVVGKATARCFIEYVTEVLVHDVVKERSTNTLQETLDSDLVFICLPTPQVKNGTCCNTQILFNFFNHVTRYVAGSICTSYVIRSTVPVGTTEDLVNTFALRSIVHNPEFLTARCALTDVQLPSRNVVGVPSGLRQCDSYRLLVELLDRRFPGVPNHVMSSSSSEAVKLMQNSFFAVKVAFWNELYAYCQKAGLDWKEIMPAILADGRISHSHTNVPGPDGKLGFGGECLPKDLANFIHCQKKVGLQPHVCSAAYTRNIHDRGEVASITAEEHIREALAHDC